MSPGPLEFKEKSYLTDAPPIDMPNNTVKLYQPILLDFQTTYMLCRELLCRCSCKTVATQSACLLTFCHSISHVSWRCASLSAIPVGMVSHYQQRLLVWCLTISRTWGCCDSVTHYRSCLLVWYIYISHACWCGSSL